MKKKTLRCKYCGKVIKRGKFCNHEEYMLWIKQNGTKHHNLLESLSNDNRCIQCGKLMDVNRVSAYCEQCEMHIEYEHEVTIY